ncbi:MAG: hypothetical protein OHK0022_46690 [Roseiflexaceae bacterium]
MTVNLKNLRAAVQAFDWPKVFREVLRWTRPTDQKRVIPVEQRRYTLTPIADTGGMQVYQVASDDGMLPPHATRRRIENRLRKEQVEHILIFEDAARQEAVLQWIKRGQERSRSREYHYRRGDPGDFLIQRLSGIAFTINDFDAQGRIEISKVRDRVNKNLDVESVTKRFYDEFTRQRKAFQDFLSGIPLESDQRWYVSVLLNRLMFIYFIQSKRFLDNKPNYLVDKLEESKQDGENRYYRRFLRTLFFKGFALEPQERDQETRKLLGNVPYLNGGLFLPHPIEERYGDAIDLPDAAFERLFTFFGAWRWHLSERPGLEQKEIDPDVLGFIFEKYINQKQMGAYYTREDITGYICRSTIIPALFDKANLSLEPLQLPQTIRTYLYPAVTQQDYLPTETTREHTERQERVARLVSDAEAGQVVTINDAITANLDLERMIIDLVPRLDALAVKRLYDALVSLSVLDPTCGAPRGALRYCPNGYQKRRHNTGRDHSSPPCYGG